MFWFHSIEIWCHQERFCLLAPPTCLAEPPALPSWRVGWPCAVASISVEVQGTASATLGADGKATSRAVMS